MSSGSRTRSRSIVLGLFDGVTEKERLDKTSQILDKFLRVQKLNKIFEGNEEKVPCSLVVKGISHGSGFFQIRMDDLLKLARNDLAWRTVFSQEGFNVHVKITDPNAVHVEKGLGKDDLPYRAYEREYGFGDLSIKAWIEAETMESGLIPPPVGCSRFSGATYEPLFVSFTKMWVTKINFCFPRPH